jgi:hypothetical protein
LCKLERLFKPSLSLSLRLSLSSVVCQARLVGLCNPDKNFHSIILPNKRPAPPGREAIGFVGHHCMKSISSIITLSCFLAALQLNSQSTDELITTRYEIHIRQAQGLISIDGDLIDPGWIGAATADSFWQQKPLDNVQASQQTHVMITYDDKGLYIGATCFDNPDYFVRTLKRDDWQVSDEFGVAIDAIGQKALAYHFGVNALGGETEALIAGANLPDNTWDNRWTSAVRRFEDRWTVEMFIPFKTLRYKSGETTWGIQFVRIDPTTNEVHVWAPVPRQFGEFDLGYFGNLQWDQAPARQGNNIAIIPYATTTLTKPGPEAPTDIKAAIGGDAKIALTSSLNLDLTTNPDFSQVEVDQQVTNLTRFGIFFPERRQFFIENSDVFTGFGTFLGAEQPFYSRRIGLDDAGRTVPILYGIRLTGNINPQLRIGAFNIHAQDQESKLGNNYSSATFQYKVGSRSFLKGLFLNRQGYHRSDILRDDFGRNAGGEFEHLTDDGVWQFKVGALTSIKEGFTSKNNHLYGRAGYSGQRFRTLLELQQMGENYFADMGFTGRLEQYDPIQNEIVRVGFAQISNMTDLYTYPENAKHINFLWSGAENFLYLNPDGSINEWYLRLRHFFHYKNTSILRFRFNNNYVDLLYPFALTEVPLPAKSYNMMELNVQYNSDNRKPVSGEVFVVYGQFFGGTKLTSRFNLILRQQPWGNFTVGLEQNNIYLPEPYGNLDLTLATARVEINFRKNVFWTTFFQYNTQANNFNLNSRLQWRFAPMSDLYIVYTDNYRVEPAFGPKDKTLVVKMNYWLSL